MDHLWIVFAFLTLGIPLVQESGELLTNKSAMVELSQYLMDGYNKDVRPVKNWRKPITVYIKIAIYAILGVISTTFNQLLMAKKDQMNGYNLLPTDEKNQLLKSYIWYNQSWVDEFLQWDPTKFDNLTRFSIATQSIWLPDIMIEEAVSSEDSPAVPYVYVNYRGRVMNNIPIHITTACKLDVYYFPFDVANCSMSFSSWLHTAQDINISFARMPHESHNIINAHVTEGEWDLLEVVRDYKESTDPDRVFGEITFYIILKRKPLFYVVNVIFPSTILMIMDTIGFFIPPESGERISFKITLLLGYSVFLVIASETLPAIGAPLIGIYFLMCMLLLMISLAESIFIVRICHKKNLFLQVPGWLKKMALGKMAQVLLIKDKISASCSIKRGTSGNTEEINIDSLSTYCNRRVYDCNVLEQETRRYTNPIEAMNSVLKEIESMLKHLNKPVEENNEWLCVAYVLDTLFFRLYLALLIAYALIMVTLWSN